MRRATVNSQSSHIIHSETDQNKPFQPLAPARPHRGGPGRLLRAPRAYESALSCAARARHAPSAGIPRQGSPRGSPRTPTLIFCELRSQHRFFAAKDLASLARLVPHLVKEPGAERWSGREEDSRPDAQEIRDGGVAPSRALPLPGDYKPPGPRYAPALLGGAGGKTGALRVASDPQPQPAGGRGHPLPQSYSYEQALLAEDGGTVADQNAPTSVAR